MPSPTVAVGGGISIASALISKGSNDKSADRQAQSSSEAIGSAQQVMADAQVQAAELIRQGQAEAAGAIIQAAKISAKSVLDAAALSVEAQERFFAIADRKLEPFRKQGLIAGEELASMLGIPNAKGQLVPYDTQKLKDTPGYQFFFEEGQQAVEKSAAGTKLSGEQVQDQTTFGQGYAERYFQTRVDDLMKLYGIGREAATSLANAAVNTGGNIGSTYTNMGNSLAGIYSNQGTDLANTALNGSLAQANSLSDYAANFGNLAITQGLNNNSLYRQQNYNNNRMYGDIARGATNAWSRYNSPEQRAIRLDNDLNDSFSNNSDIF